MRMFSVLSDIFQGKWTPLRTILRRYGTAKTTFAVTILSIVFSVLLTTVFLLATEGSISGSGLWIAVIVPAILAPSFEYRILSILLQLDLAEEKLKIRSTIDELTQTYNRGYFYEIANKELARAQRHGGTFCIALLDFDNFKNINDHHGHQAGDQALVKVSEICKNNLRLPDIFARYGGDEFVFIFPDTNKEMARDCLKRIHENITATTLQYENISITLSISIGLAEFSQQTSLVDHIIKEADLALYQAKHEGGNKIVY